MKNAFEPSYSEAWGAIAMCILLAGVLNGCISAQACTYFSKFKDRSVLRCAIVFIWLGSALHYACELRVLHSVLITGYPQQPLDVRIPIAFSVAIILQVLVHCCAQGVYIYRMHMFGHRVWILVPCCALVALELALGLVIAARMAYNASGAQVNAVSIQSSWVITGVFATSAVLDASITISVCVQLRQGREDGMKRTRYMVDRIIQWTIQSTVLTSAVTVTIIAIWNVQHTELWAGLCGLESDCYVCCLLALLNARTRLRARDQTSTLTMPSGIASSVREANAGLPAPAVDSVIPPPPVRRVIS